MLPPTKPFYRYDLKVEVPATEVAVLVDALDGEEFSLRDKLGKDELSRQLEAQELEVDMLSDESWPEFRHDIETLSTYLSEPISGREICVEPCGAEPRLTGWLILGRRGETERVALDLAWDAGAQEVVNHGIDKRAVRRRWKELSDWVRSSLTTQNAGLGGA